MVIQRAALDYTLWIFHAEQLGEKYVVGDLTGIPLLKFSLDTGARAVERVAAELETERKSTDSLLDLVIIGAGVSGVAAAIEAKRRHLSYQLLEARDASCSSQNAEFHSGKKT